jgi:hypothetical protein
LLYFAHFLKQILLFSGEEGRSCAAATGIPTACFILLIFVYKSFNFQVKKEAAGQLSLVSPQLALFCSFFKNKSF